MIDEEFMAEAIREALSGMAEGEVPIGAVATQDGKMVARGHNRRNAHSDITAHAEIQCLRELSSKFQNENGDLKFNLSDVTIYSTLEPCAMCLGAMIHYGIGRVVFGEYDLMLGACGSKFDFHAEAPIEVCGGVLRQEARRPLLRFFEKQLGRPSVQWKDIELPPN
jgi:tRNA(adenine34) deaminase